MAEEEGKKEEEKLEFTPEGEALGYISLDQARVLALRHARDNAGFYGPRYANRELVWDELSAEESEDFYRVRLSYRPARRFWGQPGVELSTIDKAGTVTLRQIPEEPQAKLFFRQAHATFAFAAALAIGARLQQRGATRGCGKRAKTLGYNRSVSIGSGGEGHLPGALQQVM